MNFERAYYFLFNAITDALRAIQQEDILRGVDILKNAQQQTETWYVEESEPEQNN